MPLRRPPRHRGHSGRHVPVRPRPRGAGIVTKASPNYKGIEVGDHVVFSAIPSCGHCRWCSSNLQSLCNLAAGILAGPRWTDGTFRVHTTDGTPVGQMCGISTFLETTTVSINSVVKIDKDIPLDKACLVGCGVSTGWGSAVNLGNVEPGHTVIVMGIGGLGSAALQGARHAGASHVIAVDPVAFKRDSAKTFGATHAVATIEEAAELAKQSTNGQGADASSSPSASSNPNTSPRHWPRSARPAPSSSPPSANTPGSVCRSRSPT